MTLEEVKKDWAAEVVTVKQIDWLLAEVERLSSVDMRTLMAYEAGRKSAALECVKIAERSVPIKIAGLIRKEFGL